MHTVAIPIIEESSPAITPSDRQRFSSLSSNTSVLVARTHTESVIDRSSPYNIIETSTDMDDDDDEEGKEDDENDEVLLKEKENTLSPSSSLTSGTDVYMDAVDVLNEEQDDHISGRRISYSFD